MKFKTYLIIFLSASILVMFTYYITKHYFSANVIYDTTSNNNRGSNICPVCNLGRCPAYEAYEIGDNDRAFESVVEVPTAMTKGAGEIWVLDDDGTVIKNLGGGAWVGYGLNHEDKTEIVVSWASKFTEDGLGQIERVERYFEYRNGDFTLTKVKFVPFKRYLP